MAEVKKVVIGGPHLLEIGNPCGCFFLGHPLPSDDKGADAIGQMIAIAAFVIGGVGKRIFWEDGY
ncbi:MAG: hypothetical protein DYG89_28430 [Caldilinea sp. CFX5]|nr:hypothetical protein [Caldilinea sp. CFX5]